MNLGLRMTAAAAALALCCAATPADAAEDGDFVIDTAGDLADLCSAEPDTALYQAAIHMCQGYLLGVHHFHTALALELGNDIYCPPAPARAPSRNAVTEAFTSWVAAHQEIRAKEALNGLLKWAAETYPCPTTE